MDSFRFIFPGAEGKEPDASPASANPNAKAFVTAAERQEKDILTSDYLGKDGRGEGTVTNLSSHAYRPNEKELDVEIRRQIRSFLEPRLAEYRKMTWQSLDAGLEDIYRRAIDSAREGIFSELYGHLSNPSGTDLTQSFTDERIRQELSALLDERN